jgi:hypothetical protein
MGGTVPAAIDIARGHRRYSGGVSEPSTDAPPPSTLRWAAGLLVGQAVVILALLGYQAATARVRDWRDAAIVLGFALSMAAVLGFLGWALLRRRPWARGPAVVLELMLLPIGWFMVAAGVAWLGIPVFALGLGGAGLLIAPPTRAALDDG